MIAALKAYHARVEVYDPLIDLQEATATYCLDCMPQMPASAVHGRLYTSKIQCRCLIAPGGDA